MKPMTREEILRDTAQWLVEENEKAESSGEGWDDTVDIASAGVDLAYTVLAYLDRGNEE